MLYGDINRQRLKIINEHVVADTIDYLDAQFAFSEDWDGLEKWAHFAKDGEVYDIRLTDDCIRKEDHLNLSAGIWKVYLHGNEFSGGMVIKRITTNAAILKVEPTGALNGEPFPEMPASVTEQILARLENIEQNGGGGSGGMWYGTTSSGVRESIKEVTTVSGDFKLEKGSQVSVKFLTNSEYCQALNVDGTGVVYIHETYVDGAADLPAGTAPSLWHNLGQINTFIYDGKYFIVEDGVRATADNQLFGKVGVSDSVTLDSGDYVASSRAAKRAYDKAVEAYEKAGSGGGSGGGMNATAKSLLITILRNGVYTSDQSANITALENALNESGGDDDADTGGVTQMGSVLYITGGVTATQSGTVLKIA